MDSEYVETSKADRPLWLMKCPPVVSSCLQQVDGSEPSPPVAKVVLSIDPLHADDDDSHTQFTLELAATESGDTPKCYTMDMSKEFVPMSVFSESSQGKISVEGKILNKFDMRPNNVNLETYGKLFRERTNKYMHKSRQTQVIDSDSRAIMKPVPEMTSSLASGPTDKMKMPTKETEMKRARMDRREVEEFIFKLFDRQPNWSLRNLIQKTDQPEQYLRDILKELCVYNNKGTDQGTYELKPEYRRTSE